MAYAYGVDWVSVDRGADARRRASQGATQPMAWLALRKDGRHMVGRAPAAWAGQVPAAAAWAAAVGDGVIVERVDAERVWVCLAADGLPVPGFDVVGDEATARDKFHEAITLGVEAARIFGELDWVEIPPTESNRRAFRDIVAGVSERELAALRLKMFSAGAGVSRALLVLLGVTLLGAAGAAIWLKRHEAQQQLALKQARQAAAQLRTATMSRAEQDARRREQAIAQQRQEMLMAWGRTVGLPDAAAFVARIAHTPAALAGYQAGRAALAGTSWSIEWTSGGGSSDDVALGAAAGAIGATQVCDPWKASCRWEGVAGAGIPFDGQRLADVDEVDSWLGGMHRGLAGKLSQGEARDWNLLGVREREYVAGGTGLAAFGGMLTVLENVPGLRVVGQEFTVPSGAWTLTFEVWGGV